MPIPDGDLIQIIDAAVSQAVKAAGDWINCRPGCTHCCIGPFTITERDAARLRAGFAEAPAEEKARIARRAEEARAAMEQDFPGNWHTGRVGGQAEADAFDMQHPWLPCPVLDLETGRCTLHAWRPVACRLHGPALQIDGEAIRPCRLNYAGATAEEIEQRRVTITLPELPASPLTYIAWAIMPSTLL